MMIGWVFILFGAGIFHLTPLLKPEVQEENLKWHKILCELVDERKRNGD